MDKMNIFYSTINRSQHIIRYGEFFKRELLKRPDVQLFPVEKEAHINDLINQFKVTPDFIFFDDFTKNFPMHGLKQTEILKGVLYWDVHATQDAFRTFVWKNNINLIFSFYRDAFLGFFPEFAKQLRWLPNHVHTEEFRDYGLQKEIDFLLMGEIHDKVYPLRAKIAKEMAGTNGFVHHKHPGYRDFLPCEEKEQLVGEAFAREKAFYYLEHEEERLQIAKRGYHLVRKHHTTVIRAEQFIKISKNEIVT
jgi:spore maturation protein CgeB